MGVETGSTLPTHLLDLPLDVGSEATTTLRAYAGRWLVLYFYPKDNTPGCTTESRDFQSLLPQFQALGADVVGVSRDSARSHVNFKQKQSLEFALVSDAQDTLCRAFGVIQVKKNYGREYEGIVRSTYLIDPQHRVVHTWQPVKVPGHAQAVLNLLRSL